MLNRKGLNNCTKCGCEGYFDGEIDEDETENNDELDRRAAIISLNLSKKKKKYR